MTLTPAPRGLVVPLSPPQILVRARYLAGLAGSDFLDPYVRAPLARCPPIYYRLPDHNGGKDPTAPDPADRWLTSGKRPITAITCDCSGGDAWIHGHDRYQPKRQAAAVGYRGWWNTDSKIRDATRTLGPRSGARCFVAEDRPFVGAILVCKSGSRGHAIGHEETILEIPGEWDPRERACWAAIVTSGIRGSGRTANGPSTGAGWWKTGALFLRSVMQPD